MINVDARNKTMAMKEVNMLRPLTHDGLIRLIEAFDNSVIITSIKINQTHQIRSILIYETFVLFSGRILHCH
jgi:bifunctional DNase/RNase